ncbi:hypothetical protein DFJ73DRAFT_776874 [Zopfochytrium polystomum]|nr:hypothetical protein DFJ73DRAFT_776874 [Zopfochytrium polystomum]
MLLAKSVVSLLFIATILIAAVWSAVADPSTPGGSGGRNLKYRKIEKTPVESAKINVLAGSEKGNQIGSRVGGIDACPGSGHQQQAVAVKEESAKAASFVCRAVVAAWAMKKRISTGRSGSPATAASAPSSSVHSGGQKIAPRANGWKPNAAEITKQITDQQKRVGLPTASDSTARTAAVPACGRWVREARRKRRDGEMCGAVAAPKGAATATTTTAKVAAGKAKEPAAKPAAKAASGKKK